MRRALRRSRSRGLTIAELLNVIGLAAVLGALAMAGVSRYVRDTRTAEAVGSLTLISSGAASYYEASDANQPAGTDPAAAHAMRHFPPSSRHSVPEDLVDVRGKRYMSTLADWSGSPWRDLRFSIPQGQYYAYSFKSDGTGAGSSAQASAQGDLDGDGHGSRFSVSISPDKTTMNAKAGPIEKQSPHE